MGLPIRPIRIDGCCAHITLTRGYEAVIDIDDLALIEQWNWHAMVSHQTVYAVRAEWINGKQTLIRMHRVILGNPDASLIVDHRDTIGLNNRRSNLRIANAAENSWNRRKRIDNKSGLKGVNFHKKSGKWVARIMFSGRRISLGYFDNPEDAYAILADARVRYHGSFGRMA